MSVLSPIVREKGGVKITVTSCYCCFLKLLQLPRCLIGGYHVLSPISHFIPVDIALISI